MAIQADRKRLSADGLLGILRAKIEKIADPREGAGRISLPDALMSGFAMFSLKYPSLLTFDAHRKDGNLKSIYRIEQIPSDTQMRAILDEVSPDVLRPLFKDVFRELQRGKELEQFEFMDKSYLLSLDGTGYFSSEKIHCASCLEKVHKNTAVTYSHQMLGAVIVHPDFKEVIPLAPEPIIRQDGQTKNDCERNAAKRFFEKLRQDHPHLRLIVTEDALSSNAPHIREILKHKMHYILGVKEGDHPFLFAQIEKAVQDNLTTQFEIIDDSFPIKTIHRFRFLNQVPLNEANKDLLVNVLEYWEITPDKTKHFAWVTDFTITQRNANTIMQGGRARWKIENETFNTLKNQGYQFEHNFGHGYKNLSVVLAYLMMLAFLVDQVQQLCCPLFQDVLLKLGSKTALWFKLRGLFDNHIISSMRQMFLALLFGFKKQPLLPSNSS